jgi:thiosulfate reductase/polysulfide reductase chain A
MRKLSRRHFLTYTAATGAVGGLGPWGMQEVNAAQVQAALAGSDVWIPTCCNMCGGTTGVLAHVVNGRAIKLEPNSANPVGISNISTDYTALKSTGARMCGKGNASLMSLYDPDRVKTPLKRVAGSARGSGQFVPISYEQALSEIAAKLGVMRSSVGADKLLWFTEDATAVAIQEAFCNAFGTPNMHNHSNICDVGRKVGFEKTLGFHRPLPDLRNTKYMLLFGWNPLGAIKWVHLPRILLDGLAKGAKLVVVDPRCSETADKAIDDFRGEWLPIKPGTDGAFALAMANVIIKEGLHDKAFVANWSVGFAEYSALVANRTPEWAAPITGIAADTIRRIAREVAAAKPAVIDTWSGTAQHTNGVEGTRAIAMLAGLLGQIDAPGTLILPDRKGPKFNVGTPSTLPRVDGRGTKYPYGHSSGIYVEARDAMLTGAPYQPKAAVFVMQNFVFSVPNSAKTIAALNKLDLIVSVDTHLSETALMADYIIPGSNYLERYEIAPQWVTFPVVALRQPVVAPVHGQRLEYDFVMDLARALGHTGYPFSGSYEQFLDDGLQAGVGISLAQLKALPGATWIGGETRYRKYTLAGSTGAATGFATPSGKFEFHSAQMAAKGLNPLPDYLPPQDRTSSAYPLALINWKEALHTHSRTMNNRWLMELRGENMLWINTSKASALGIQDGDTVNIQNEHGSAQAKARVTGRIHPDVVGMCHGFGHWGLGPVAKGKGVNDTQFVPGRAEPISGMAVHKDAAVKVSFVARATTSTSATRS